MLTSYTQKKSIKVNNIEQNGMQIHSLSLIMFILPIFLNNSNAGCSYGSQKVSYYKDYIIIFKMYWLGTHHLLCNILEKMVISLEGYCNSKVCKSLLFK